MVQSETVLRWLVGLSISAAALAVAWGQVNRTDAASFQGYPVLYRTNLLTAGVTACVVGQDGFTTCRGEAPDYSDRAKPAEWPGRPVRSAP